jgi:F-type H+-transporting ATPase subunit a
VTLSGNKDYWGHIFNPPGVPTMVKPIMILIEFLSMFIKPFALMLRLFANITAGHIIILSFVGLIFIAANLAGTVGGFATSVLSGLFMLFMNVLELFVAALQAYVFTVLSAVFIGQAVEEHHHEEAHH